MERADMLARLMTQAEGQGGDLITLRALVEEASELGASRALARLGLGDRKAEGDLGELRELLGLWRDAKANAWKAALGWIMRAALALLLLGLAVKLGIGEMLK